MTEQLEAELLKHTQSKENPIGDAQASYKSLAGMAADEGMLQSDDDMETNPDKLTKKEFTQIISADHSTPGLVQLNLNYLV